MINIGIEESKRKEIAQELGKLLASSYTLYLKTHKYHWNVTGSMFQTLHLMFEEHYTALSTAVDEIAERIRVMGVKAPGSYSEFAKLSVIKEDIELERSSNEMISHLLADHESIIRLSKEILEVLDGANDEGTAGLIGARLEYHEKTAWMLRSLID